MTSTRTFHVVLDERGVAWIDDTNVKVIEVAADHLAHGTSPEEMHLQYPHLSLAQICAALAYYYDHRAELDAALEGQMREYERRRAAGADSPGRAKLRQQGLI
jgi:uncharacterized protein (DUF433 family)